jgi:hypothetical protein
MGTRGPIPARSDQKRRRNKSESPTDSVTLEGVVEVPEPGDWHSTALAWYGSLAESGQSRFYEPSDWQTAQVAAEALHRFLTDDKPNAQLLAQFNAMQATLMVTEGARRRAGIELERRVLQPEEEGPRGGNVTRMADRRKRLTSDAS